jgi:hypothetical protein
VFKERLLTNLDHLGRHLDLVVAGLSLDTIAVSVQSTI